jgi:hypothetical protein
MSLLWFSVYTFCWPTLPKIKSTTIWRRLIHLQEQQTTTSNFWATNWKSTI